MEKTPYIPRILDAELAELLAAVPALNRLGSIRLADEMQWLQFLQVDPLEG